MMWILASASPRRKELLSQIGLPFEVMVSEADENVGENLPPGELVEKLSFAKAAAVSEKLYAVSSIFGKKNEPADRKDKVAGDIH
ncbi:MAG: Maf family protein, partial [Lachnospiraceae bacterium]|nr:Maf family protein [Lachnospiraceae bacterium]